MASQLALGGVRFVVIGGLAARAHGSVRITEDLDICYDTEPRNLDRLATILRGWNAYLRGVESGLPFTMDQKQFGITPVMTLVTNQGAIDVMDRVVGVGGYREVLAESVEATFEGVPVRVLDLPALLRAKRATGRKKDRDQLRELESLLELRRRTKG